MHIRIDKDFEPYYEISPDKKADIKRLKDTLKISLTTSVISGLSGMIIMCFGAQFISATFLDPSCHAYYLCCEGLPLYSSAFLFIAINIVLVGYLQSIEKATKATIFTILRGFLFSIPCFILLPMLLGANGLWLALPLAEILTTAIISITFIYTSKWFLDYLFVVTNYEFHVVI